METISYQNWDVSPEENMDLKILYFEKEILKVSELYIPS